MIMRGNSSSPRLEDLAVGVQNGNSILSSQALHWSCPEICHERPGQAVVSLSCLLISSRVSRIAEVWHENYIHSIFAGEQIVGPNVRSSTPPRSAMLHDGIVAFVGNGLAISIAYLGSFFPSSRTSTRATLLVL